MKRLFLICLFVSLTTLSNSHITYADEEETAEEKTVVTFDGETSESTEVEPVTIKQMKDNLEDLKDEKEDLGDKWKILNSVNGKVIDFLKTDLNNADITVIQNLSLDFQQRKRFYEQQLKDNSQENYDTSVATDNDTAAVKANFIQYKLDFYKLLVPYVDTQKKDAYLDYIRGNIEIEKEDKDIKEKIYKQEEVIEERVDTIKEKIKEHKRALEEKLEILIRQKIQEKITAIMVRESIQSMSTQNKILLLEKVIERFVTSKDKLIEGSQESEYLRKKVAIYDIAIDIVQNEIFNLELSQ